MTDLSKNKETPTLSPKQAENQTPEYLLLKEEIIGDLDTAVRKSQDGEITNIELFASAANAWRKAVRNSILKSAIEKEIRKRRMALHQMARLNIAKQGDPIKKRYNPNYWLGTLAIKENPQAFLLSRIASLRNLFESL